jgi:mono/diheme cytochrome c family protein
VKTAEALLSTGYGKALTVKSGLFAVLISLGAVNLLVLSPLLRRAGGKAIRWLRRTVRAEAALGLLVLLAAGVLTGTPPAFEALQAQQRLGYVQRAREDGVQLTLRVAPGAVGENEFGVDILDPRPGAEAADTEVLLRFTSGSLGVTQAEAKTVDGKRFTVRGSYLALAGEWQIEVILRRAGFDDVSHTYLINLGMASEDPEGETTALKDNPIPANHESTAAGQALYEEYCLACHGPQGKGDGPVGLTLNPRPADLTQHALPGVHPDGQLFEWISRGYPNSVMPAYEETLSEKQRWHLVNYLRILAEETGR